MGEIKPFYRNYRKCKSATQIWEDNAEYIFDKDYAKSARHFVLAYKLIQSDLEKLFEYIDPSEKCVGAFSYRTHELLMRVCIEVEANFKAILKENGYSKDSTNMNDYRKVDVTHHLSSYAVILPMWREGHRIWVPFSSWKDHRGAKWPNGSKDGRKPLNPSWYEAYNTSKHNRQDNFHMANLENLIMAVCGLLVLITSQFKDIDFTSSQIVGGYTHSDYYPEEFAIGGLFRIKYPDDWRSDEMYDFDWEVIRSQDNRFSKFDYDSLPT